MRKRQPQANWSCLIAGYDMASTAGSGLSPAGRRNPKIARLGWMSAAI
jgi:hypothetical protein